MEDKGKLYSRFKKFTGFVWRERNTSIIVFLCSFILPLFNIPLPLMFKGFVDSLAYNPQISNIILTGLWLGFAYFTFKIGEGLREYVTQKYREKTTLRLKDIFFGHFMNIELGYYAQQGSGYFVGRLNEVENLKELLVDQLGGAISSLTLGIVSLSILFHLNPLCALIFLSYVPIEIWGIAIVRKKIMNKSKASQEARACFIERAQEYIQNVEKIKASNIGEGIRERFRRVNEKVYDSILNLLRWRIGYDTILECSSVPFFIVSFIILGISIVHGERTVGDLIALNQFATYFLGSFMRLANIIQQAFISLASFERVFDIFEKEPEIKEGTIDAATFRNMRNSYDINVCDVSFKYPGQDNYALKDIIFSAAMGEKTIIVGPSGSGKTTLLKLLTRMYDPERGEIYIGKTNVKTLKYEALHAFITYLPQEPFILRGSIMENLRLFAAERNETCVKGILKEAGLSEFFESLPRGYETEVQEMGRGLSGGERQALSIARVFLKKAKIILLDEPTSWQDPSLEKIALSCIERVAKDAVMIIIAHKPSTIMIGHKIALFDNGKTIDSGSHHDLLFRNNIYASYFSAIQNDANAHPTYIPRLGQ